MSTPVEFIIARGNEGPCNPFAQAQTNIQSALIVRGDDQ